MRRLAGVLAFLLVLLVGVAGPAQAAESCVSRNDLDPAARPAWDELNPAGAVCVPLVSGQTATQSFGTWLATPGPVQSNYVAPGGGTVINASRLPATVGGLTGPVSTVAAQSSGVNWGAALTNGLLLVGGGLTAWVLHWTGDPDTVLPVDGGDPNVSGPLTYEPDGSTGCGWWTSSTTDPAFVVNVGAGGPYDIHNASNFSRTYRCWVPAGESWFYSAVGTWPPPSPPSSSGGATPTRHVQQTVNCRRSDGSTHSVTRTTTVDPDTTNVPGLLCPQGERATGAQVDIQSDLGTGTVSTGAATLTAPDWLLALDPACFTGSGCLMTQTAPPSTELDPTPTPSLSATPAPTPLPVEDPGGDPEVVPDADFCGIEWTDLINGLIIFKAVGCALSWAFVPGGGYLEGKVSSVRTAWSTSSLGTFVNSAAGIPLALTGWDSSAGGCTGPTFTVPLGEVTQTIQPLNACSEPMSTVAFWVRTVSTLIVGIGGVIFVAYPILRAMGMPQLRRSSGDSDGD